MTRFMIRIMPPDGDVFAPGAFSSNIGRPVTVGVFSGVLEDAQVAADGRCAELTVEAPEAVARSLTGESGSETARHWLMTALTRDGNRVSFPAVEDVRTLIADAEHALTAAFKAALTVEPSLKAPYPDDPRWSPWTRWVERPAREAHDTAMRLRVWQRQQPEITAAADATGPVQDGDRQWDACKSCGHTITRTGAEPWRHASAGSAQPRHPAAPPRRRPNPA